MHPNDIPSPHDPIDTYYYCRNLMSKNGLMHWHLTFMEPGSSLTLKTYNYLVYKSPQNYKAVCVPQIQFIGLNPLACFK